MNVLATTNDKKITFDPSLFAPSEEPIFELSDSCNYFLCSGKFTDKKTKLIP
jgi:hypothetical protein